MGRGMFEIVPAGYSAEQMASGHLRNTPFAPSPAAGMGSLTYIPLLCLTLRNSTF